jgi:hypothetical protein
MRALEFGDAGWSSKVKDGEVSGAMMPEALRLGVIMKEI